MRPLLVAALWFSLLACGDDGGVEDAGADGEADAMVDDGVADPMEPAAPVLTPCPAGTVETPRDGAPTECWPIVEPTCTDGEVRFFGDTDCAPVGGGCEGEFPTAPATGAVYVRAGASGGDGTEAAPFDTIARGITAAGRGGTVLVGAGTYDELLFIDEEVEIRGLCPQRTILTSTTADTINAVLNIISGSRVTVTGISVRDAPRGGVAVSGRAEATLADVVVDGVGVYGVYVDLEATATIDGLAVRDVATSPDGRFGDGLVVDTAASATARRVSIERTHTTAVNVLGGATLDLERATLRDVMPDGMGIGGRGLSVKAASTLVAGDLFLERLRDVAIEVRDAGTTAAIDFAVVDDTQLDVDGERGRALCSFDGAATTVRRLLARGVGDSAFLLGAGTAELEDVVLRDARGQEDGTFGRFIEVGGSNTLTGRRIHCEEARDIGVALSGAGTTAILEDLQVAGVRGRVADGLVGRGINVQQGASLEIHRARVADTRNNGVFVDGATLDGEDLDVRSVAPPDGTRRGRGMNLQLGAEVTLSRTRVSDVFDLGVFAASLDTRATFRDLTVRMVTAPPCPSGEDCGVDIGGVGVGSYARAAVSVERIAIEGATLCGLHVAEGGELDVTGGYIRDNRIGACVQVDGYDLGRIDSPRYEDNVTNLEVTSLPVPSSDVELD